MRHLILCTFGILLSLPLWAQSNSPVILIKAGHVLDVKTGQMLNDREILVQGDRIRSMGAAGSNRDFKGTVIDLSRATVLPGLIDCHTHLFLHPGILEEQATKETATYRTLIAGVNARKTLEAGFTALRDLGNEGADFGDVSVRDAINNGFIPGPRLQVATRAIAMTGSHDDIKGYNFELHLPGFSMIADGPDEVRKAVRTQIKYGADIIKVYATGGIMTPGDEPEYSEFTEQEIRVAVEEAAHQGRKVAAHAMGPQGIKNAVRAGVASIEHGDLIDDEAIRMMAAKHVYLVPTLTAGDEILKSPNLPDFALRKMRRVADIQKTGLLKAVKAGVPIALGTDAGDFPHGQNAREFALMVDVGMTPLQALQAGTINAAELLGWSDRMGALEPGKFADIIAFEGDPLRDVHVLEHVHFVMKGGVVVKNDWAR
ncbi:MAG: amidohydrolase family protein [Acidobacteriia bacterium]|nr:amidohydrolase family protein [Terriglobia bacterium]